MSFYGWSVAQVRTGVTGAQGWVYYNWARDHEQSIWGGNEYIVGGYIAQEIERQHGKLRRTQR